MSRLIYHIKVQESFRGSLPHALLSEISTLSQISCSYCSCLESMVCSLVMQFWNEYFFQICEERLSTFKLQTEKCGVLKNAFKSYILA
uniref:Uncharacterized protein n=1 Tax=Anguilla anguilla TaxID=7936 RepID=A0A0E9WRA4_ANGAN